MYLRGFYEFRLGDSIVTEVGRIITATAVAAMLVICARAFIDGGTHVANLGARLWVYSAVFLAAGRAGFALEARRLWIHALAVRPTLIIGAGNVGRLIARGCVTVPSSDCARSATSTTTRGPAATRTSRCSGA